MIGWREEDVVRGGLDRASFAYFSSNGLQNRLWVASGLCVFDDQVRIRYLFQHSSSTQISAARRFLLGCLRSVHVSDIVTTVWMAKGDVAACHARACEVAPPPAPVIGSHVAKELIDRSRVVRYPSSGRLLGSGMRPYLRLPSGSPYLRCSALSLCARVKSAPVTDAPGIADRVNLADRDGRATTRFLSAAWRRCVSAEMAMGATASPLALSTLWSR